jgi:hypothetical protein
MQAKQQYILVFHRIRDLLAKQHRQRESAARSFGGIF